MQDYTNINEYLDNNFISTHAYFIFKYSCIIDGFFPVNRLFPRTMSGRLITQSKNYSYSNQMKLADNLNVFNYLVELEKNEDSPFLMSKELQQTIFDYHNETIKRISNMLLFLHFRDAKSSELTEDMFIDYVIKYLISDYDKKYNSRKKLLYQDGIIYHEDIEIIFIDSVGDFLNKISMNSQNSVDKTAYYRGHESWYFYGIPSLFRLENWEEKEKNMKNELTTYCSSEIDACSTNFDKLVLMQHYSLPTRLLDITSNPLVALYFACIDSKDNQPGEVVTYSIPNEMIHSFSSQEVTVLSCLSELNLLQKESLLKGGQGFDEAIEYLTKICQEDTIGFTNNITLHSL